MRSWPRKYTIFSINIGGQSSIWQAFSELQQQTCAHCSWAVLCASSGEVVPASLQFRSSVGLNFGLSDQFCSSSCLVRYPWREVHYLVQAIQPRVCFQNDSLSRLRCSRVASAYGWVTIVILSMVKRAHPLYSNRHHHHDC